MAEKFATQNPDLARKFETGVKHFTMADVAQHRSSNDCWIVLFKKVYDVTSFVKQHPGGALALWNVAGTFFLFCLFFLLIVKNRYRF